MYSPGPPLWNRISLLRFVVFQLCVRAREEGEPDPPPPRNRMISLLPYTYTQTHKHTHTHPHTHTHTHHVSVCVWHSLSAHALLPSLRSILWCAGQAGYDAGCGTPVVGVLQASRLQALVFGAGGVGGGGERTAHNHIYIYICIYIYIYYIYILFTHFLLYLCRCLYVRISAVGSEHTVMDHVSFIASICLGLLPPTCTHEHVHGCMRLPTIHPRICLFGCLSACLPTCMPTYTHLSNFLTLTQQST